MRKMYFGSVNYLKNNNAQINFITFIQKHRINLNDILEKFRLMFRDNEIE